MAWLKCVDHDKRPAHLVPQYFQKICEIMKKVCAQCFIWFNTVFAACFHTDELYNRCDVNRLYIFFSHKN